MNRRSTRCRPSRKRGTSPSPACPVMRRGCASTNTEASMSEHGSAAVGVAFATPCEEPRRGCGAPGAALRRADAPGDVAEISPEAVVASSEEREWRRIRVVKTRHAGGHFEVPPLGHHCVAVHLRPSLEVSLRVGASEFDRMLRPGDVSIVPAGDGADWRWAEGRTVHMLHLYLHPSFLRLAAEASDVNPTLIAI